MNFIRPATGQDAGAIAYVHVQSWKTTYAGIVPRAYLDGLNATERESLWHEWLTHDIQVFVATVEAEIVGFICGGPAREPVQDCDAELFAIYLLERAQRSGIGTALLKALAVSLTQKGFKSMSVWVLKSNSSSEFYERSGAVAVLSKEIEVGGAMLPVLAYRWSDLNTIASVLPSEREP